MTPKGDAMRYAVFLFAILGAGATGFFGYRWFQETTDPEGMQKVEAAALELAFSGEEAKAKDLVPEFERRSRTWPFLLAAAPAAIAAGIVVMMRWGIIAAPLLLLAVVLPAIFNLSSLIFTSPLLLGGLLALFVWPQKSAGVLQEVG
jgi:hypothetical protein